MVQRDGEYTGLKATLIPVEVIAKSPLAPVKPFSHYSSLTSPCSFVFVSTPDNSLKTQKPHDVLTLLLGLLAGSGRQEQETSEEGIEPSSQDKATVHCNRAGILPLELLLALWNTL